MKINIFEDGYQPVEIRGKEIKDIIEIHSQYKREESIELIFYVKCDGDIIETSKKLALDETTGKWIGKEKETQLYKKCVADVDKIIIYEKGEGVVYVRSPLINFSFENAPLYQILMIAVGGPVLEFVYYSDIALLDINLPEKLVEQFPGPSFGIEGIRKLTNTDYPYPILGTIVKPCAGLTPEEVSEKCYFAAKGGVKFIKDDEKMLGSSYCPQKKKIKLVSEKLKKAQEETGNICLYAPHLVERADKIIDTAKRYIEWGATALMLNTVLGHNFEVLKILRESPDINVPIYAHSGGRSCLSTGNRRIDDTVILKLIRLCGGDFFQHGVFGVKDTHIASLDDNLLSHLVSVMREETKGIKNIIPVAAGGLNISKLEKNLKEHYDYKYGYGVALLAGSGLLSHPDGPEKGAIEFKEKIEEIIKNEKRNIFN